MAAITDEQLCSIFEMYREAFLKFDLGTMLWMVLELEKTDPEALHCLRYFRRELAAGNY